ncbi:MAG: hypothetical protein KDD11_12960 [Acidobacteria bacterium]|nr:hypothetical protein [Acidobacteriota bacterium]
MSRRPQDDRPDDLDPILCELALTDPATGRVVETVRDEETDRLLDAYRTGSLGDEERRLLTARLSREPGLRRRLTERAGVAAAPPAALRQRVLEAVARPRRRRPTRLWLAAAASVLIAAAFALWRLPGPLPPDFEYTVEVRGLSVTRDLDGPRETAVEAYPDTVVRLTLRSVASSAPAAAIAVYRLRGSRLELVDRSLLPGRAEGSTLILAAEARTLFGTTPGVHHLYAVEARGGDLPASLALPAGELPAARLAQGGRRRVHTLSIRLLPEAPDVITPPGGSPP